MTSLIEEELEKNGLTFLTESPVFNSIIQKARGELRKRRVCASHKIPFHPLNCICKKEYNLYSDIEEILGR